MGRVPLVAYRPGHHLGWGALGQGIVGYEGPLTVPAFNLETDGTRGIRFTDRPEGDSALTM